MGRDKANKPRRQRGQVLLADIEDRPMMTAEEWAQAAGHALQTSAAGLTLFRSEVPGLGDVDVDDYSGVDFADLAVPTVLIESKPQMVKLRGGSQVVDGQVEAAVHAGMGRIPATGAVVRPAADWGLHLAADGRMDLRLTGGPHTLPWARLHGEAGPQWLSVAQSLGWVLCLYGPHLGVLPPGGSKTYTPEERLAEIAEARTIGRIAGALVGFHTAAPAGEG